ncbi:hypothetical protein LOK49_LG08G00352 [Camellia lanceoleosa]|uniref:Uncharacterized protein n=1 Tax=Camellia lanceoleosa TaxID=1840588 RepID=A0ACC0GSH5_9ERIC|nr:hypothetical protein LOK49_LG08G00352 [Camellia lanceoleosa]
MNDEEDDDDDDRVAATAADDYAADDKEYEEKSKKESLAFFFLATIENRSLFLPVSFQQVDGNSDSWRSLLPNSTASFLWEDLGRRRLLELLVDGTDPLKSQTYNIDEISDHQPIHVAGGPSKALRVSILKEEKINVIKLSDWMPENDAVRINQRFQENVCMRQTVLISNAILNIKKDLLGQPLQLLSGVDILGNASSAVGHMSKGAAALSMDKKFIQSRQRQVSLKLIYALSFCINVVNWLLFALQEISNLFL